MTRRKPRLKPIGLRRADAARYVGISPAAWDRLVAAGKAPQPAKLGGCCVWHRGLLSKWLAMGAPDRETFEARIRHATT